MSNESCRTLGWVARCNLMALAVVVFVVVVVLPTSFRASAASTPPFLLALGDSLAAGYQPSFAISLPPVDPSSGYRDRGYPGSYAADVASARGLQLMDLGCPGETTESMLGVPALSQCAQLYDAEFGAHSQLGAAEAFLRRHPGAVDLITLDIGSNDLDHCMSSTQVSAACLKANDVQIEKNLTTIVRSLRSLLGQLDPNGRIISMNYYDPFLGLAYSPGGAEGAKLALASLVGVEAFNAELAVTYRAVGVASANVAGAFRITASLPLAGYHGKLLPSDVVSACDLTWMCPVGSKASPDIHPNLTGYRVIAGAFEQALGT